METDICSRRKIVSVDTVVCIQNQTRKHAPGAKVLMDKHFNIYWLPDHLHSDNGKEFVNNLRRELFSEFKIQHTTTLLYNLSSNPVD